LPATLSGGLKQLVTCLYRECEKDVKSPRKSAKSAFRRKAVADAAVRVDQALAGQRFAQLRAQAADVDIDGAIVVARLNDEFVVKRFRMIDGCPWLYPANDAYDPIRVTEDTDFEIWGRVTFAITSLC